MADARARIRMTEDEVWSFIEQCRNLQVATINKDGTPHLTTLWFAVDGRTLVFDSYAKAQKTVNLRRDPRVAVLLEGGVGYQDLRGVSINGHAEVITDEQQSCGLKVRIVSRYDTVTPRAELVSRAEKSRGKRLVIRVTPQRIASWDHGKLV